MQRGYTTALEAFLVFDSGLSLVELGEGTMDCRSGLSLTVFSHEWLPLLSSEEPEQG